MIKITGSIIAFVFAMLMTFQASVNAQEKHAGYYYPKPKSIETYEARIDTLPEATRKARIAFVVGLTNQAMQAPYPPRYAVFAKGELAEKLIIIGLDDEVMKSVYRMRATLAQMTLMARVTPIFQQVDAKLELTFLDMAFMMGFSQVTISDGDKLTHQFKIK